ncbi:L-aspartate oxidase [Acidicapsa acidisoli]|uniref:L-aspartate oxidase n=1 Tax=Acidicapsa acidisoli TaxID=1615681 RepID=UPI0021E0A4DB|nr:L-aspartate oxidase [Acidicapsa acidisoli]
MSEVEFTDYLIIGAGVAGLRAAIELADHGNVLVVTKESLGESNTHYAQGGIAVATEGPEDIALHLEDTVAAGDGLVHRPAAAVLVEEGPQRVAELIEWGAGFDQLNGQLLRTREAAHSHPRILHANGDATGAEISRSLVAFARNHPRIRFAEWTMATNLVITDGRAIAADLTDQDATSRRISARAILIASGGAGQVYSDTTNPAVATGDGIALAAHAGAELADMEFYQFHPTALSLPGVPRFLLSEALRGEGAYLRNDRGERFMERYHASLELAPRDVVARAIAREGMGPQPSQSRPVYLDMRHVQGVDLSHRFPGISRFLATHGLSLSADLIPVRPAAHYLMGGIRTDLDGRTSVPGLYAAGEAACTGVHGANRLASNSLLEGLVFGARAAKAMLEDAASLAPVQASGPAPTLPPNSINTNDETQLTQLIQHLQRTMWRTAGLLRHEQTLREGLSKIQTIETSVGSIAQQSRSSRALIEAQSLLAVSRTILLSALARTESRGAHFREDHPRRDDANFRKHSILTQTTNGAEQPSFAAW